MGTVWEVGAVLVMGGGDGCPTVMCFVPLTKLVYKVNLMHILP